VTRFFVPDCAGRTAADSYDAIRRTAEERTGYRPTERRIAALTSRRDGRDLETVVGEADPVCGETVMAILDLGRHLPYLVHCVGNTSVAQQLLVNKPVYDVTEFTS
jgi:hypothetical protein